MRTLCINIVTLVVLWFTLPGVAHSHPSDGLILDPLPANYGNGLHPPEAAFAEIVFTEEFPAAETLTHAEKYIIAGTRDSPESPDAGWLSWWIDVFDVVDSYNRKFGGVPSVLSPEVITAILGEDRIAEFPDDLEKYKSPLTNQYPRLDALYDSPGDLYIRELTESEISHYASFDLCMYSIYYDRLFFPYGMFLDPERRANQTAYPVDSVGPIYFLRVHGWNGPIVELMTYHWSVDGDPKEFWK